MYVLSLLSGYPSSNPSSNPLSVITGHLSGLYPLYLAQTPVEDIDGTTPSLEQLPEALPDTVGNGSIPLDEGAARIFDAGREVSSNIAAGFDPLWQNVMQGSLYQAMADVGTLLAVLALGIFLVQWYQRLTAGEGDLAFGNLIWPLIVIVLLSNNGAVLSTVTLELRNIGNQVNETVLGSAVRNVSLQEQYQNSRRTAAIADAEAVSISECRENHRNPRARGLGVCIRQARQKADELRQQYGLEPTKAGWLRSTIQAFVRNFLFLIHGAFQYVVEIILIITALLGPLAIGLSLFPGSAKAMFTWLEGMVSMFLIKLTLNLISGLASYATSLQETNSYSLLLPILLGLMAPVLSVLVGLQGGAAFFNALSTASVYFGYRKAGSAIKGAATVPIRTLRRRLLRR